MLVGIVRRGAWQRPWGMPPRARLVERVEYTPRRRVARAAAFGARAPLLRGGCSRRFQFGLCRKPAWQLGASFPIAIAGSPAKAWQAGNSRLRLPPQPREHPKRPTYPALPTCAKYGLQGVAQARAAQRKRRTFARTRLTRTFAGAGCFALTPSQHARATSPHPALLGED